MTAKNRNFNDYRDFVVEQGSNYTKWNSGKLECWGRSTLTNAVNTASGSSFVSNNLTIYYPVDFVGTNPFVTASLMRHDINGGVTLSTITLKGFVFRVFMTTSFGAGYPYYVDWHAVGKWK